MTSTVSLVLWMPALSSEKMRVRPEVVVGMVLEVVPVATQSSYLKAAKNAPVAISFTGLLP